MKKTTIQRLGRFSVHMLCWGIILLPQIDELIWLQKILYWFAGATFTWILYVPSTPDHEDHARVQPDQDRYEP